MYSLKKDLFTYTLSKAIVGVMFEIKDNNESNSVKTTLFDFNLALASSEFDGQHLKAKKDGEFIKLDSHLTGTSLNVAIEEVRWARNLLLSFHDNKVGRTKIVHDKYEDVYKIYQDDKTLTLDKDSVSSIINYLEGYVDSVSGFSASASDKFVYLKEESTELLFILTFNFLLLLRSFYDTDNSDGDIQSVPVIHVP